MNVFVELIVTLFDLSKAMFWGTVYSIFPAPQKSVEGEKVLITGSGSGLGRLMALRFARRGAVIIGWDINEPGNQKTAELVKETGGKMYTYVCNIGNNNDVRQVAEQVSRDVGDVDILINNAGIVTGKRFMDCPDDMIMKTMEVNTMAHFWTIKYILPSMLAKDHGHIVAIASILGTDGIASTSDYSASKAAAMRLMESLRMELYVANKDHIITTTVCPFVIETGLFAGCSSRFPWLLPVLDPEETADRIVKAVLTNQRVLYMPRIMYLMGIMKAVLPVDACLALHKFFGATNFMDTFVGRAKRD